MRENILKDKSYAFAVDIVGLCRNLHKKKEYILSNQLLRSGTAVGALVSEAEFGQSRADFISKLTIALKEANESLYWLSLIGDTTDGFKDICELLSDELHEIIALLVASINTCKKA